MVNINPCLSEKRNNPIKINLQFFAEPGAAPESGAAPAPDAPAPASFAEAGERYLKSLDSVVDPGQTAPPQADPPPAQEVVPPASTDVMELYKQHGVTKFTAPEKAVEAHVALEKFSTKLSQENASLKRQMAELQAKMQAAPPAAPKAADEPPAKLEIDPDAFISKMYENPEEALAPLKEAWKQELLKELQPALQSVNSLTESGREAAARAAHESAAANFFSAHAEAEGFIDQMTEILSQDPTFFQLADPEQITDLMEKTLTFVKGQAYVAPTKPEDVLNQLLTDEAMFQKYIASNPDIRTKLLSSAVNDMRGVKAPPVVSTHGGATMTPKPMDKPSTFEELGERLKRAHGIT